MQKTITACLVAGLASAINTSMPEPLPHYSFACSDESANEVTALRDNIRNLIREKDGELDNPLLIRIDDEIARDVAHACLGAQQNDEGRIRAYLSEANVSSEDPWSKFNDAEATATKEKESIISMALDVMEQAKLNLAKNDEYTGERVLNKITEDSLERIQKAKEVFNQQMVNA